MAQAFSMGFDVRRVMLMATAVCWTFAVIGLYMVLIALRVTGFSFETALAPQHVEQSLRLLTAAPLSADRVLLWLAASIFWWLGFARIITPVFRSIALEVARDERLDQKGLTVASHRLSGLTAFSPLTSGAIIALLFACVLVWALIAKIPGATGDVSAAVLLPLALIASLLGAAVIIVTVVSLPLMTPAAVIECRDLMDVISRASAYVLQRPFKYIFGLLAKLGVTVAAAAVSGAVFLLAWALIYVALVAVGEGEFALSAYHMTRRSGSVDDAHGLGAVCFAAAFWGSAIIWAGWVLTVGAATDVYLYLVMRYEVDGVTFDEIMIPTEHLKQHSLTAEDTRKQQLAAQEAAQAAAETAKS